MFFIVWFLNGFFAFLRFWGGFLRGGFVSVSFEYLLGLMLGSGGGERKGVG